MLVPTCIIKYELPITLKLGPKTAAQVPFRHDSIPPLHMPHTYIHPHCMHVCRTNMSNDSSVYMRSCQFRHSSITTCIRSLRQSLCGWLMGASSHSLHRHMITSENLRTFTDRWLCRPPVHGDVCSALSTLPISPSSRCKRRVLSPTLSIGLRLDTSGSTDGPEYGHQLPLGASH